MKVPGWTVMRNCASGMQALDSAINNIRAGPLEPRARGRRRRAVARAAALLRRDGAVAVELVRGEDARPARGARREVQARLPRAGDRPHEGPDRSDGRPADGPDRGEPRVPLRHHARARWTSSRRAATRACSRRRRRATSTARSCRCSTRRASSTRRTTACARTRRPRTSRSCKPFFDRKYGNVTAGNSSQITDGARVARARVRARGRQAQARRRSGRIVDSRVGGARSRRRWGSGPCTRRRRS